MSTASHALHDEIAATLARWEADEARVRATLAAPGINRPADVAHLSGLEMFAAIGCGELPSVPIGASLDFYPVEYELGRFVFQGRPSAKFKIGRAHV